MLKTNYGCIYRYAFLWKASSAYIRKKLNSMIFLMYINRCIQIKKYLH